MTMAAIAENVSAENSGVPETIADDPTPAKIRPTSAPRVMLAATAHRFSHRSSTPIAQAILFTTAVTLTSAANTSTAGKKNSETSTPQAHVHEEDRHEHRADGRDSVLDAVHRLLVPEVLRLSPVHNQAGSERPHDVR